MASELNYSSDDEYKISPDDEKLREEQQERIERLNDFADMLVKFPNTKGKMTTQQLFKQTRRNMSQIDKDDILLLIIKDCIDDIVDYSNGPIKKVIELTTKQLEKAKFAIMFMLDAGANRKIIEDPKILLKFVTVPIQRIKDPKGVKKNFRQINKICFSNIYNMEK
jgi:lysyl-tRNA synthetase class I